MDIDEALSLHGVPANMEEWADFKRQVSGSLWLDVVLLQQPNPDHFLFMCDPIHGVRFEMRRVDVIQVLPTDKTIEHLGESFRVVKLFVKHDALIKKLSYHYAVSPTSPRF